MRYHLVLLSGFLAMGMIACESKTDCEKAVDHIIEIAGKDPSLPRAEKNAMANMSNRKEMLEQCNQSFRPAGGVDCILKTKSLADVDACRQKMLKE